VHDLVQMGSGPRTVAEKLRRFDDASWRRRRAFLGARRTPHIRERVNIPKSVTGFARVLLAKGRGCVRGQLGSCFESHCRGVSGTEHFFEWPWCGVETERWL